MNPKADDLTNAVDSVKAMAVSTKAAAAKISAVFDARKARGPGDAAAEKADWENVLGTLGNQILAQTKELKLISRQLTKYQRSVAAAGQGMVYEFENLQSRLRQKVQ